METCSKTWFFKVFALFLDQGYFVSKGEMGVLVCFRDNWKNHSKTLRKWDISSFSPIFVPP